MTPLAQSYLLKSREMRAAAEAAKDPRDKAVYLLLAKTYEQLAGPPPGWSTKLLTRDLAELKADTHAALKAAASAPPPTDPPPPPVAPPAPAGRTFTVDTAGRAEPLKLGKPAHIPSLIEF